MRGALIKNGVVENVILYEDGYTPPTGYQLVASESCGPGDLWNGKKFTKPPYVPPPPAPSDDG